MRAASFNHEHMKQFWLICSLHMKEPPPNCWDVKNLKDKLLFNVAQVGDPPQGGALSSLCVWFIGKRQEIGMNPE